MFAALKAGQPAAVVNSFCVKCGKNTNHNQHFAGGIRCECGWFNADYSAARANFLEMEKKTIKILLGATVALVGLFAHFATWGSYGFSVPFVTVGRMTGMLSVAGYEELAQVCTEIGKYGCAKDAYYGQYSSKGQLNGLVKLARLQIRLNENKGALTALETYFKAGGASGEAAVLHGKLLEKFGRTDEAIKAYELAIAKTGDFLPLTATTNLVHIYMTRGQYAKAYEYVENFQNSADNAIGYLNTEKAQLETHLRKQANRPAKGRRPAKANAPKRMV